MKTFLRRIKDWSNGNQGVLALVAAIVAFLGIIPFKDIDYSPATSILQSLFAILTYPVQIPIYALLVLVFASGLFAFYLARKRPKSKPSVEKILIGTWRNQWGSLPGNFEIAEITADGKYLVDGRHAFDIHDFSYDTANKEIRFIKVGIGPDYRKLTNVLKVQGEHLLTGNELNYPIMYTKIE
jgi:hypothetical protein